MAVLQRGNIFCDTEHQGQTVICQVSRCGEKNLLFLAYLGASESFEPILSAPACCESLFAASVMLTRVFCSVLFVLMLKPQALEYAVW